MQIIDMTRADAMIVYNPNRDIFEDRRYINDYSIKDVQVALTRARLGIQLIANVIKSDTFIFQFWYPKFSYICWAALHIFVYYFDSRYLLTYLLVGLIWLTLTHSLWWSKQVTPFLE